MKGLRALRLDAGLTQRQLAVMAGTSSYHVSLFERGLRVPKVLVKERMAEALHVAPVELGTATSGCPRNPYVERPRCAHCGRCLDMRSRRAASQSRILTESEGYCTPCGRPLTDEAKERVPRDGFIAFVSSLTHHEPVRWFGEQAS